ncbi:hypothetical protein [Methylobacterium planeticum]|uniref:Uncharacterized protein n=1 Tax=Methylobacterium planeticum TaxID=2615211 RepID=A0A6N6MQ94_9HYPH|nr:hypothetical protein [Methylobacterium planeticum]KAB1072785.1 hypothetical protein F6X51_14360 [Methylobacterium planeticum]
MPVPLSRPVRTTSAVLALLASCLVATPSEARRGETPPAAAAPAKPPAKPPAAPGVTPGVTWTAGEAPAANCTRSRRKLWQEGEGWIVRTVTACR